MGPIVVRDENGTITIPPEAAGPAKPHTRYSVETEGDTILLIPVGEDALPDGERLCKEVEPKNLPPEERAREFRNWVKNLNPKAPHLSDEAMRRENMYD